jgi:radical SAM superfamily enzyme YgiQ (UPF0313 family)
MLSSKRRTVLLIQLPIPPLGVEPIRGNVPLAGAYLKLFAQSKGLDAFFEIDLLSPALCNTLGDRALVRELADRRPWMVGFTCYLWNIERTLWVARELKRLLPRVRIVLGGPEITADNTWVLQSDEGVCDFAVIGEGEQTFAQLLLALEGDQWPPVAIDGLHVCGAAGPPGFRTPLADLNRLGSPYTAGILNAADEEMLLLETARGCVFKCKFCYYPKSYDKQYYLADDTVLANLRHAEECGAREVFLLDPTLNQRKDFPDLLRLLARGNTRRRFTYFGELRGEGITAATAKLLREANFAEVEVGLQSIDPEAQKQMDRKNNLRAFERGVRAMLDEGIRVKVDLIVGLPGDTVDSVRAGLDFLHDSQLYSDVQVFNLSILPGTAFRQEAGALELSYQPRPPYYLRRTPAMSTESLYRLLEDAQELFGVEFDALPTPVLDFDFAADGQRVQFIDLDQDERAANVPAGVNQAFTLWFRGPSFAGRGSQVAQHTRRILEANPFTTLQIVLEPTGHSAPEPVPAQMLAEVMSACQEKPSYLDRYHAVLPGRYKGAKRLIVLMPADLRQSVSEDWIDETGELATLVWRGETREAQQADWQPWELAVGH